LTLPLEVGVSDLIDLTFTYKWTYGFFSLGPQYVTIRYKEETRTFTYGDAHCQEADELVRRLIEYSPIEITHVHGGILQPLVRKWNDWNECGE
jgi:hypothetical protein